MERPRRQSTTRHRPAATALVLVLALAGGGLLPAQVEQEDGDVTRAEAIAIVIQELIVPATRTRPVVAFLGRQPLAPGDAVWPFDQPELRREIAAPTWFAWIDDDPRALFAHDTRFVFIDVATGAVEVIEAEWWPVVNGESRFTSDEEWADLELVVYSELHRAPEGEW